MSAKVKMVKKSLKDPELTDLFNKMLGTSDPDPNIVIPKFKKVLEKATGLLKLFESLTKTTFPFYKMFHNDFQKGFDEIKVFIKDGYTEIQGYDLKEDDHVLSDAELKELNTSPEKLTEFLANAQEKYKITNLQEKWTKLKDCKLIQEYLFIARNIKGLLRDEMKRSTSEIPDLAAKESLKSNFIKNADGDYLQIMQFSTINFKQIFLSQDMTPDLEKYLLMFFYLLYKDTLEIVNIITSPDIDVEKFSEMLVDKIGDFKKQIPRCDAAFGKIAESVDLLKGNFNKYYTDFIISRDNPSIMIEHFVLDVAGTCSGNVEIVRQFREIMKFIGKNMNQGKVNDPRMKKMFNMLSQNLDLLERETDKKKRPSVATEKKD